MLEFRTMLVNFGRVRGDFLDVEGVEGVEAVEPGRVDVVGASFARTEGS
jgi:hypothetical protein